MSSVTVRRGALALALLAGASLVGLSTAARADDASTPAGGAGTAAPAAPAGYWDTFAISGAIDAGITTNFSNPDSHQNFGALFTDKSNQFMLNQALITAERPVTSSATDYDIGFRFQAMYGSDARFTHFADEFGTDLAIHGREQFDIVEANVQVNVPWLGDGGSVFKVGQYATPIGWEVIPASGNPFYSHSYIFNFGIPLKHTGFYAVTHVNDTLDLYYGVDSGVNTSLGSGDDNKAAAFLGGFGLNGLLDGNLTIVALAHIGPENPLTVPGADQASRQLYDAVITYKYSDALSFTTELNYAKDDLFHAQALGAAQYLAYTLDDMMTLNLRAEVFRDDNGFFVATFPGPNDFVRVLRGLPGVSTEFGVLNKFTPNTYGELTAGVTIKPPVPDMITGLMVRPEIRWDRSLADKKTFDDGKEEDQFTLAADVILPF